MDELEFWILLNNNITLVSPRPRQTIVQLFLALRKSPDVAPLIPASITYHVCHFHRLKKPVSLVRDGTSHQDDEFLVKVKKACAEESNRELVNPIFTEVRELAEEFSSRHIYLVIDLPDVFKQSEEAISVLREKHRPLFKCLQITVQDLTKWCKDDVTDNLQDGVFTNDDDHPDFKDIHDALVKPRLYQVVEGQERDLANARSFKTQFDRNFALAGIQPSTVTSGREFAAFYNILRSFNQDVENINKSRSSYLKASNFTVNFVQPPFFSEDDDSRSFQYHPEKSWEFPIFLDTKLSRGAFRKFTPRSDWMVAPRNFGIPSIISEVISQKSESDRHRMLVQAIAIARTGQYLLKSTSKRRFFVVAIYVNAKMVASRYIVMQTNPGDAETKSVSIYQKDFDLTDTEQQIDFLREMYNLATEITALSGDLDPSKQNSLSALKVDAKKVLSLTSAHGKTKTTGTTKLGTIEEGHEGENEPQDEDALGIFEAEDIQNVLRQMNYKIVFIPWGHPDLAMIVSETGDTHAYLKFVKREREIQVLKYLSEIESPSNHTISGVQFWPVEGGTVVSMSVGGGWLTLMDRPTEHLWSVALQLFEAVAFMHEHNVAHMDLKPQNIIIPSQGGRLSIIDFSVSIRVRGPNVKYSGVVGTEDYMAPEVQKGEYKPMLADLWSCGRTLEEFCLRCNPSADRTKLLEIAGQLMNQDPEARPKMNTLLECMAPSQRGEADVVPPTLRHLQAISPLCA